MRTVHRLGVVLTARISVTDEGVLCVRAIFGLEDAGTLPSEVVWEGPLDHAQLPSTLQRLRLLGWTGDSLQNLELKNRQKMILKIGYRVVRDRVMDRAVRRDFQVSDFWHFGMALMGVDTALPGKQLRTEIQAAERIVDASEVPADALAMKQDYEKLRSSLEQAHLPNEPYQAAPGTKGLLLEKVGEEEPTTLAEDLKDLGLTVPQQTFDPYVESPAKRVFVESAEGQEQIRERVRRLLGSGKGTEVAKALGLQDLKAFAKLLSPPDPVEEAFSAEAMALTKMADRSDGRRHANEPTTGQLLDELRAANPPTPFITVGDRLLVVADDIQPPDPSTRMEKEILRGQLDNLMHEEVQLRTQYDNLVGSTASFPAEERTRLRAAKKAEIEATRTRISETAAKLGQLTEASLQRPTDTAASASN